MIVELKNITKRIHGSVVLANIDLMLHSGSITGVIGKNGSGKTMLLKTIAGLVKPTSGTVTIDRCELWSDLGYPPSIGVLIESPSFLGALSGFENLRMLSSIKRIIDDDAIRDTLDLLGLDDSSKKYRHYSLGMKQRLGIAAAIMESPKLILLDEPINALDEEGVSLLEGIVKRHRNEGACIVIVCHEEQFLNRVSDRILRLEDGHIARIDNISHPQQ